MHCEFWEHFEGKSFLMQNLFLDFHTLSLKMTMTFKMNLWQWRLYLVW